MSKKKTYFCCICESKVVSLQHQTNTEIMNTTFIYNQIAEVSLGKDVYTLELAQNDCGKLYRVKTNGVVVKGMKNLSKELKSFFSIKK